MKFSFKIFVFKIKLRRFMQELNNFEIFDPKSDVIFRNIFGTDAQIFANFSESILFNGEKKIESVEFLNLDTQVNHGDDKESRFDVHAVLNDGTHVNIEMQIQSSAEY